jgi:hypothetical protein
MRKTAIEERSIFRLVFITCPSNPAYQEILLAAVYKSPGSTRNDADITGLLSFKHECILAGDLNAKHPAWNSALSNPLGKKLFDRSDFEILAPQYSTHPLWEKEIYWILWCIRISDSQMSLSLIFWIQITYQ